MTPILWILLFQRDPVRPLDALQKAAAAAPAISESQRRPADPDQALPEKRFQKLVDALQRFADEYNRDRAELWPLHQAEAVRESYRDFERSLFAGDRPRLP